MWMWMAHPKPLPIFIKNWIPVSAPNIFYHKNRENDLYVKQILEIKCKIKNIKTLAITTAGWTCKPLKKSFLALTIHFG